MSSPSKKILISTGEVSGDLHAARLVKSLKKFDANLDIRAIGGEHLRNAGAQIIFDSKKLAVVGLIEVLTHGKTIYQAYRVIKNCLKNAPPDVLICVDYPGFNLKIAKLAHQMGIKVLYYISPQIWAWKKWRIKTIQKNVDQMAVILPFEKRLYESAQVPVEFVGHPSALSVTTQMNKLDACQHFKLDPNQKIIGLVPGSRLGELKYCLPLILKSAEKLSKRYPNAQFVVPRAPTLSDQDFRPFLKNTSLAIKFFDQDRYELLNVCDALIVTSGTVTLEIALLQKPMVIIYKVSPITYWLGRCIVHYDRFGLCNIIAQKNIVPELLQYQATPENIVTAIGRMLDDATYRQQIRTQFAELKQQLLVPEGDQKLANMVLKLTGIPLKLTSTST